MTESAGREKDRSEVAALAVKGVLIAVLGNALLRLSETGPQWSGVSIVGTLCATVLALAAFLDRALYRERAADKGGVLTPTGTRPS